MFSKDDVRKDGTITKSGGVSMLNILTAMTAGMC